MRTIDADALREDLRRFFPSEVLEGIEPKTLFAQIIHDIDNAPTVETPIIYEFKGCDNCELERPKGEWILQYRNLNGEYYTCSQCERMILVDPEESLSDYPFCHCGADMRKESKDENT